jgi:pyrroloquinoline quinone biosynthesis protein B
MQVRLLGTAAGGGFPQWNCNCANCRGVRAGAPGLRPRSQSCVAVSADGQCWFLLNASPDLRLQIESFAPLLPRGVGRSSGIHGVLLTSADLDHTLGLLLLREGGRLVVHATAAVRQALDEGLHLGDVLACYAGLDWHEPPATDEPLRLCDGRPSGLRYAAFPIPGKPPRYRERRARPAAGDVVGYRVLDERTGGRLGLLPGIARFNDTVQARFGDCDLILLDGTFWSEDELQAQGVSRLSAAAMGHLPVGGPGGSLVRVAALGAGRTVYLHINNTNPMLRVGSPEHQEVLAAGTEVGEDGLEFSL